MMLRWLWLSIVVVILDQLTKLWIDSSMTLHERLPLIEGYFDLTLAYNPGAAFSFLADAGGWQRWFFTILSTVVTLILVVWLKRLQAHEKITAVALALIIGGAIGNLIDRIAYGHVIDFLLVYYQQWSWPAFNVADSAISIGVVLMLLALFHSSPSQPE